MKRHLLLEGSIGCGKSTLIQSRIRSEINRSGGFAVQRLVYKNNTLYGFRIVPARKCQQGNLLITDLEDDIPDVFLSFKDGVATLNPDVFLTTGLSLLKGIPGHPFALLDEIGGCEVAIPEFMEQLKAVLQGDTPCIGVLKSPSNAVTTASYTGLDPGLMHSFYEWVHSQKAIEIVQTFGKNDEAAASCIDRWYRTNRIVGG